MLGIKIVNKEKRLVEFRRNKKRGKKLVAISSPAGYLRCRRCWMKEKYCSINGQLCLSVAPALGEYSIFFRDETDKDGT
jgi:hypothetical protein